MGPNCLLGRSSSLIPRIRSIQWHPNRVTHAFIDLCNEIDFSGLGCAICAGFAATRLLAGGCAASIRSLAGWVTPTSPRRSTSTDTSSNHPMSPLPRFSARCSMVQSERRNLGPHRIADSSAVGGRSSLPARLSRSMRSP